MTDRFKPQTENLFRGLPGGVEFRDVSADESSSVMFGHFAVFNRWTEISSWYEGNFLERIAPGAFKRTIKNSLRNIKVQFDHGYDTFVGSSVLGPIDVLREDEIGAYYEVPLLDTDVNRDRILPMLQGRLMSGESRGSVLGASFRFRVLDQSISEEPEPSEWNPKGLPERTITEAALFEFGPVVFPAYPDATATASAGMRSLSDHYLDRQRSMSAPASRTADDAEDPREHSEAPTVRTVQVWASTLMLLKGAQR